MTPRPPVQPAALSWFRRIVGPLSRPFRWAVAHLADGRYPSAYGITIGLVWTAAGPVLLGCALFDALRDGDAAWGLAVSGILVATMGVLVSRFSRFPRRVTLLQLFGSVVIGAAAAIVVVMAAHLATGTVDGIDEAFLEATASVTATNATTVDPESLSDGVMLLRALTQWVSSAAVVVMVVRVLPHLGTGGLDDGGPATRSARRLSPRVGGTLGRLLLLYVALTGLMFVGYSVAGMPLEDSGLHAMTTISTGGFSTEAASIGAYESALIEWVAIAGMAIAGCSLPLVFMTIRRMDVSRFVRSVELRIYLLLLGFVAFAIIAWSDSPLSATTIRGAIFASTSAISTTGFVAGDITAMPGGGQALLIVLMAVGGMSASVAGGFKVVRLLALVSYIRRELVRSLHPSAVQTIKLGRSSLGDVAIHRILGEVLLSLFILAIGAVMLAEGGLGVTSAADGVTATVSFAVSSLSNVGPALGQMGPTGHLNALDGLGHVAAGLLMFIGRVSVTPVLVTLGGLMRPVHRTVRRRSRGRVRQGVR